VDDVSARAAQRDIVEGSLPARRSAPNPVLTTYLLSAKRHWLTCPSGLPAELAPAHRYTIDADLPGCHVCFDACPPTPSAANSRSSRIDQNSASSATLPAVASRRGPRRDRLFELAKGGSSEPRTKLPEADHRRQELQRPEGETVLEVARRRASTSRRLCTKPAQRPGALPPAWSRSKSTSSSGCTAWSRRHEGQDGPRASRPARELPQDVSPTTTLTARRPARTPARRTSTPRVHGGSGRGDAARRSIVREELRSRHPRRVCPRYCEPVCRREPWTSPSPSAALHRAAATTPTRRPGAERPPASASRSSRRPGRLGIRLFLTSAATRSRSTTPTEKGRRSLRYSIPSSACRKGRRQGAGPSMGRRRALRRESELATSRSRRLFDAGFDAVVISIGTWTSPGTSLPATTPRSRPRRPQRVREGRAVRFTTRVAVIGDGITGPGRGAHRAPQGRQRSRRQSPSTRPTASRPARASSPPPSRGIKFEFGTWPRRSRARPAGAGRGVRARGPQKGPLQRSQRLALDVAATTVVLPPATRPSSGRAPTTSLSADGVRSSQLLHRPHAGERRVAAGDAITGAQSVIHAVGRRQALGARRRRLAARHISSSSRRSWPSTTACPTSTSSRTPRRSRARLRLAERARSGSRWRERRTCGSRHNAQGRQGQASVATEVRGREGLQPGAARAEAERCLQCEAPASATASCRARVDYGITDNDLVVKGGCVREVAARTSIRSSGATGSLHAAAAACALPRSAARPARLHGRGSRSTSTRPTAKPWQLADCIPAAAA